MKNLSKKIVEALDGNGFYVCSNEDQNGEYVAEIETYSPEGEDVIVVIWHDGTIAGFVRAFREYANGFDADEHAAQWIEHRGENGCPSSIRALIEDADAIQKMLDDMADALEKVA